MKLKFIDAQNTEAREEGWMGINPAQGLQKAQHSPSSIPCREQNIPGHPLASPKEWFN